MLLDNIICYLVQLVTQKGLSDKKIKNVGKWPLSQIPEVVAPTSPKACKYVTAIIEP